MKITHSKYIIVGAGLSGLTTAHKLIESGETNILILEGRSRLGGRIKTHNNIDLGATWFQEQHTLVNHSLKSLGIDKFPQYQKGKSVLVYNTMAPAHYFESDTNGPSAKRVAGGSFALIDVLSKSFINKIVLNTSVIAISEKNNQIELQTKNTKYIAEKVIITIPPKLASILTYAPELPVDMQTLMKQTHTWMSNAIKVGISFTSPFWKSKKLSGTVIGQVGPVIELYDHSNHEENSYHLMGFVNEGLRDVTPKQRKERILDYLEKYLGSEIRDYTAYEEKDWSQDKFTSCSNLKSVYMSPQYGDSRYSNFYFDGKLLFSGTETSPHYGGYLEGAIYSGLRAAEKLLQNQ